MANLELVKTSQIPFLTKIRLRQIFPNTKPNLVKPELNKQLFQLTIVSKIEELTFHIDDIVGDFELYKRRLKS